jgi:hypothetical protein
MRESVEESVGVDRGAVLLAEDQVPAAVDIREGETFSFGPPPKSSLNRFGRAIRWQESPSV